MRYVSEDVLHDNIMESMGMEYKDNLPEQPYCVTFGCGKPLTITEALAGCKCLKCQGKKKLDFSMFNRKI